MRRYLRDQAPDPAAADFTLHWLSACAAYPRLRWSITHALGEALAEAAGRKPPDEPLYLLMGRLPWFRQGEMPFSLRAALLGHLPRGLRKVVRRVLATQMLALLELAADDETGSPKRSVRWASSRVLAALDNLPRDAIQADPLLWLTLRGQRPNPLNIGWAAARFRAPPAVRAWLRADRMAATVAAVALVAGAVALGSAARDFLADNPTQERAQVEVITYSLSACGAPITGNVQLKVSGSPAAPRRDHEGVWPVLSPPNREGWFDRIVLANDRSTLLTVDQPGEISTIRIWRHGRVAFNYEPLPEGTVGDIRGIDYSPGQERVAIFGTARAEEIGLRDGTRRTIRTRVPADGPTNVAVTDVRGVRTFASIRGDELVIGARRIPLRGWPAAVGSFDGRQVLVLTCDPNGRVSPAPQAPPSAPSTAVDRVQVASVNPSRIETPKEPWKGETASGTWRRSTSPQCSMRSIFTGAGPVPFEPGSYELGPFTVYEYLRGKGAAQKCFIVDTLATSSETPDDARRLALQRGVAVYVQLRLMGFRDDRIQVQWTATRSSEPAIPGMRAQIMLGDLVNISEDKLSELAGARLGELLEDNSGAEIDVKYSYEEGRGVLYVTIRDPAGTYTFTEDALTRKVLSEQGP